jgi:hypothetical protein
MFRKGDSVVEVYPIQFDFEPEFDFVRESL